jgi:hypothetical protein
LRIADCRLKNWYWNILRRQSAIVNRKSAIPATLGQAMIADLASRLPSGIYRLGFP